MKTGVMGVKFEKLRPNKIKIIIDKDDLVKWGVSADAVAKNLPETREMFVALMKQAEQETGFACNNARLVIEAAITDEGRNLTLYVTKVDDPSERMIFDRLSAAKKTENPNSSSNNIEVYRKRKSTMVRLESFEDVIILCYAVCDYYGGTLYSYEDRYYMLVDNSRLNSATEFGTAISPRTQLLIEEHGKIVLRGNAFYTVRNSFKK